jgi:small subunit ribosomal protein S17
MAETKKQKEEGKKEEIAAGAVCNDEQCVEHGTLSARGRIFEGTVIKKFPKRIVIEFERTLFIKKYERYMKKKTRLHARVSKCKEALVSVGDYVEIQECRPLSKIIHFVYIKTIRAVGKASEEKK